MEEMTQRNKAEASKLTETLALQQVGKFVDLERKLAQRVKLPRTTRAEGVIRLAQRRDNVGQGLQRTDDLLHE